MENLPKDVLFRLALELNLPELLKLCATNKRINSLVCERNDIWYYKLNSEFPGYQMLKPTPKDNYRLLYELTQLKQKLDLKEDIYELYKLQELNLMNNEIKGLPKEIGDLSNLQTLVLRDNQLKELPKEIGNLSNLQRLYLTNNQIKEFSKEIGNLSNLEVLSLSGIKELPKEIGNLTNLQQLYLGHDNE